MWGGRKEKGKRKPADVDVRVSEARSRYKRALRDACLATLDPLMRPGMQIKVSVRARRVVSPTLWSNNPCYVVLRRASRRT